MPILPVGKTDGIIRCGRKPVAERVWGYTLIEVLFVVLVVGVLAGVTVLNFDMNSPQQILGREAQRLQRVLAAAAEEALFQGAEYGLLLGEEEYQVMKFDAQAQQWRQSDAPIFQTRRLPGAVDLVLEMEDRRFSPEQAEGVKTWPGGQQDGEEQGGGERAGMAPQVLLLSSGELTPFEIYLGAGNGAWAYRVVGDGIQAIRLEEAEVPGRAMD